MPAMPALQLLGQGAQSIEVVAEDLERDLGAHAREHVVEAVRDRLPDIDGGGQHGEPRADVGDDLLAAAARALQVDVDLGRVHAFGMLVELGPARAAADGLHLGDLQDQPLGDQAHPVGLGERDAGPQQHRDGERALVEGRQEGAGQEQGAERSDRHREDRRDHHEGLLPKGPVEQPPVAGLEHAAPARNRRGSRRRICGSR